MDTESEESDDEESDDEESDDEERESEESEGGGTGSVAIGREEEFHMEEVMSPHTLDSDFLVL